MQGLVLSPGARYPRYATNTYTRPTIFLKVVQLQYMELSKLGFASSLPRKQDDRITKSAFPQERRVSLLAFSSHLYMLGAGEGICEYPCVICR